MLELALGPWDSLNRVNTPKAPSTEELWDIRGPRLVEFIGDCTNTFFSCSYLQFL